MRSRQLLWAAGGAVIGVLLATLVSRVSAAGLPVLVGIVVVAAALGLLTPEQLLSRAARARLARISAELPTVVDLVPSEPRVVPVGRLDTDTTGALLLTNDGDLAHRLAHPRYGVPKVYEAHVWGSISAEAVAALRAGIELEDGMTAPAGVRVLERSRRSSRVELTLHEGRNRQVKRMLEAVGHRVRRLHRPRYASLDLQGLAEGRWRLLERAEVAALRRSVGL